MRKYDVDWNTIDWTKQNGRIADEVGCTREYVRLVRLKLGKPMSPDHGRQRREVQYKIIAWMCGNGAALDGQLTAVEIAEIFGCSRTAVHNAAAATGYETRGPAPAFATRAPINWDLPTKVLADIWWPQLSNAPLPSEPRTTVRCQIVANQRCQYGRPSKVEWQPFGGRAIRDPAFHRAVAVEKRKAAKWFKQQQQS